MDVIEVSPNYRRDFRRFLYISQEIPKYWAGRCQIGMKFPGQVLFSKLVETPSEAKDHLEVLETANDRSTLRIPILYATAVLVVLISKENEFLPARDKIYSLIPTILKNSEELFLFTKFTTDLGLKKGSRWQKCMNSWYSKHGADILYKDLPIVKSRYGWTHKDICNLLHMPSSPKVQLCLAYIYGGTKAILSNKTIMEKCNASEIEKIKKFDELRKCKDMSEVTPLVKDNEAIRYIHLPERFHNLLKENAEMWTILISRMNITEIFSLIPNLQNAEKLNTVCKRNGKDNKSLTRIISEISSAITKYTASPIHAFITYCNHKNYSGKLSKKKLYWDKVVARENKAKETEDSKEEETAKDVKKPGHSQKPQKKFIPSPLLNRTLLELTERSLHETKCVIDAKCLITLDMRELMFISPKSRNHKSALPASIPVVKNDNQIEVPEIKTFSEKKPTIGPQPAKCFYNGNVVPGQAGVVLALYFLKYIKNTTVAIFTHEGIKCIDLLEKPKDEKMEYLTLEEAETRLRISDAGRVQLHKPFEWAIEEKKEFDLFINIVDTPTRIKKYPKPLRTIARDVKSALLNYRETMVMPQTKSVTMTLCTQNACTTDEAVGGILDISGFDENVIDIIKNFLDGNFD